jgi:tetratricopeptide (TPR) repeat protein
MLFSTIVRQFMKFVAIGIVVGLIVCFFWPASSASLLKQARTAATKGDLPRALELASRAIAKNRQSVDALLYAGSIANRMGNSVEELGYYRQIPESANSPRIANRLKDAGELALKCGRAGDAELFFRRALKQLPDDQAIHRQLATLFLVEGRRWESSRHLFALIKSLSFTLEEIAFLGSMDETYEAEKIISFFRESVPDDFIPTMGQARIKIFQSSMSEGEAILRKILQHHPDLLEAQVQLGVIQVKGSRIEELERWRGQLPQAALEHPDTWWVLGKQARENGDVDGAIRCAWETLRRDPNHLSATYQLGQLLEAEGRTVDANAFFERAPKLETLGTTIHDLLLRKFTSKRMLLCAKTCEELGRLWEAWAWHVTCETYYPAEAIPGERERLKAQLTPEMPQTLLAHDLAQRFDFSGYPVPKTMLRRRTEDSNKSKDAVDVRFEEVTASVGLDFCYENGAKQAGRGLMIYQSIGGGVSVIDFDGDGAPDLFFPQASQATPKSTGEEATDRLYRNVDGKCIDVTAVALPPDSGYGFGAAVGDFDGDGFPDLYVANAGRNRLLRNNGDGVFQDVTDATGIQRKEWTTSCLMADLNGDGLPDLYDVKYCGGDRPFEHVCIDKTTKERTTCIPTELVAADDDLLINLGDGRFEEVGESAGIHAHDGRGLGIVAANFDREPGLDIYVANDMSANFMFLNRTKSADTTPKFDEQGVFTGTAYDLDGRAQASMGIAADDADGDGLIDLFVTNFYFESNTLYHQQPGGFFVDASREFDLRTPSILMLGFGTQFMDADLDGRPDLVVANGHVDDYSYKGIPFQMRHQFFINRGKKFVEIASNAIGPFFSKEQLGRGLARLDWNRDGRDDFAISQLIDPAALVVNRSRNVGHFVSIRLVGKTYRDAIGSEVSVSAGHQRFVKQLVAGDGFECSNERRLLFGLGDASSINEICVRWPGGTKQVFSNVTIDRDLLIIEGAETALTISKDGT